MYKNGHVKIFKNFGEFKNRANKRINGVSPEFAKKYPNYQEDNLYNLGCWNCMNCKYCIDCDSCTNLYKCLNYTNGSNISESNAYLEDCKSIVNVLKTDDTGQMSNFTDFIAKNPISFTEVFHRYKASPLIINYNFTPINLSNQNFSNLDFRNMKLSSNTCDFTGCNFAGCDFTNASITGNFTGCNFTGCDFTNASIIGNFINTLLDNATFINCDAKYCDFTNAKGSYTNFTGADLFNSKFAQSKLINCTFNETYIECVSFEYADLTDSTFIDSRDYDPNDYGSGTYCEETTFKNAIVDLDGVDFDNSDTIMPDGRCWED
jgi:uncharacterized protein YjbI with pentapeptide repeats